MRSANSINGTFPLKTKVCFLQIYQYVNYGIVSTPPGSSLFTGSPATTTAGLLGVAVDLRRRRRRPPRIKPLAHSQGGDSTFHVEAERRRASGCQTDAGASNPRDAWWGAVANAVPDGSPRRFNAFRWLRSVRVLRHVTVVRNRIDSKTLDWVSATIGQSSKSFFILLGEETFPVELRKSES